MLWEMEGRRLIGAMSKKEMLEDAGRVSVLLTAGSFTTFQRPKKASERQLIIPGWRREAEDAALVSYLAGKVQYGPDSIFKCTGTTGSQLSSVISRLHHPQG